MAYLALSTANLPDPAIDPALSASPADHFNTVLYTGNATDPHVISGVGFQPDFTWIKIRSTGGSHALYDAVRGGEAELYSNLTNAEATRTNDGITFQSDGFQIDTTRTLLNGASATFASWNWKANGSGSSNTNGSITSTVSANTTSGFSIVGYNGTQVAGDSVGHGLSSPPEMIIVKKRGGAASNWIVYHKGVASDAATDHLHLNLTDGAVDSSADWNDQAPTSSVFYLGNGTDTNDGGSGGIAHIAYCFHSVDGFSKFGSYVGNGSTDGSFIYTGFRPKWVMIKRLNAANDWLMYDTSRMPTNQADNTLAANSNAAEYTGTAVGIDILSNGFKGRVTTNPNVSSGTYIYMAFAENPFKYSNAR